MRRIALGCVVALLAVGCSAAGAPPPDFLEIAVDPLGSLDPLSPATGGGEEEMLVQRQVFEGLVRPNPESLRPEPALAASWTMSADARTYTFELRPGALFHDGRPVTASDVVASLNRLATTACAASTSPHSGAPAFLLSAVSGYEEVARRCEAVALAGVQATSDGAVTISLSEPWADFPSALANPAASVLPADADAAAGTPVGTGPYRVTRPWDGNSLELRRFDGYWGEEPAIEALRFIGYATPSLAYLDLLQGQLHYAAVPVNRAREARRGFGEEGFTRGIGLAFMGANLRNPAMHPLAFRHALSVAIDRDALAAGVFEGTRAPSGGLASPALPGVEEGACQQLCAHDPARARQLISEAYPEGAPPIRLGVPSEGTNPAVGHAVAQMLGEVGVQIEVVERSLAEHVRGVEEGDVDLYTFGWVPAYPSIDGLLRPLFRSDSPDNYARYRDPEVDRMLLEARGIADDADRMRVYRDAERRIIAGMPVVPLLWYRSAVALDPHLRSETDVLVDGTGMTSFADLRWTEEPRETPR